MPQVEWILRSDPLSNPPSFRSCRCEAKRRFRIFIRIRWPGWQLFLQIFLDIFTGPWQPGPLQPPRCKKIQRKSNSRHEDSKTDTPEEVPALLSKWRDSNPRPFGPEPKILPLFPVLSASFRKLPGISRFFRLLPPVSLFFRLFPDGFKPDIEAFSSLLSVQPSVATVRVAA